MQLDIMNKYDKIETLFIRAKKQKLLGDMEELILKRDGEVQMPEAICTNTTKKAWRKLIGNYKRVKVSPPVTSIVHTLSQADKDKYLGYSIIRIVYFGPHIFPLFLT